MSAARPSTPGALKAGRAPNPRRLLPRVIFLSRWLQVPLYPGLIVAHAGVLKARLAMAHICASSIHLLKTFINPDAVFTHTHPPHYQHYLEFAARHPVPADAACSE